MTTSVVIKAHHGLPVKVTSYDPKTGQPLVFVDPETGNRTECPAEIIPVNGERTYYVHSGQDLLVHEVQPGEIE